MTSISDTEVVNAPGGLVELGYVEITSNVGVTGTSAASPTEVIAPLTFVSDGSPLIVEFFTPRAYTDYAAGGRQLSFSLYQDGSEIIRYWGFMQNPAAAALTQPIHLVRKITPSAGVHTFGVKAFVNVGTGVVEASNSSTGMAPTFLRVSKIIQASQLLVTQSNAPIVTSLPSGNLVTGQEVYLYSSSPAGYQRQFWDGTQWNITGDSRASTGIFRCTSTTRPSSPLEGQQIYETDTKKIMTYDGVDWYAFNQLIGDSGLIGTTYNTVATHTTVQTITGMNPSVKYGKNRKLKLTASLQLYTPGGVQAILIAFYRGSTEVARFYYDPNVMNAGGSTGFTPSNIITTPGTGATETFTCRIAAASNNTVVTAYANSGANQYQQFWIEDVGPA